MSAETESTIAQDALEAIDPELRRGLEEIVEQLCADDVAKREPRDIAGAAMSMRALAANRSPGDTHVAVFTPTLREHGWTSRRTIINVCTDDAPFLVDSVGMAIARQGLTVHLLMHPVISVHRDDQGELLEIGAAGGQLESWIHLEVDRVPTEDGRNELEERLRKVFGDVHSAVQDWRSMQRACLDIVTDLRTAPPATVDPDTIDPTIEFLNWLAADNFTFLGYREHVLETDENGHEVLRSLPHTGLGILRKTASTVATLSPEAQRTAREPRLLTLTKANSRATVHRDVYLDYVGVRMFDDHGKVIGERRFLGMFTSVAYASSVTTLPIVSDKVRNVLARSGFTPNSHSGKDLLQILEEYPRDELFQDSPEHLFEVSMQATRLHERRSARVFLRKDEFGRFVSALVFIPRDRYNTTVRLRLEALLREVFGAEQVDHTTRVGESPLAQLHFVLRMPKGESVPDVNEVDLQRRLEIAILSWSQSLVDALHHEYGEEEAARLFALYGTAFPQSYKEYVSVLDAISDIELLEALAHGDQFAVRLYEDEEQGDPKRRIVTMVTPKQYPLTQVLPILTDLGVDVVDERPYAIHMSDGTVQYISDFGVVVTDSELWGDQAVAAAFEDAFTAAWTGNAESDKLNSLVLFGGLSWREIVILRAIAMYLRQTGSAFSLEYIDQALIQNPVLASGLVRLFEVRFDPDLQGDRGQQAASLNEALLQDLNEVASLDHDRIIRSFIGVIDATWRTNFYQHNAGGGPKSWVSMKLDCARVPGLPKPHPMAEIWVYSPEVEGVHMRFGTVARGGLRWSDRREDFRTEVLGLVKAQMVKNAVIVPTGSKGGFVAKALPPPSDRAAWLEGGKAAYRTFIRGLLDITDNRSGTTIVPPERVVRHDGDDSYLVVAADKGTAAFSDTANEISEEYGFWMADAFASGGSAGYDHKGMGITARGAWESVKRHFRELGHNTQAEDFTVVGIGDMSGDVFGNGMQRSEHIRLVAAFDHRHVFVDPSPDAATSYPERLRLYEKPGSSWDDYDRALISEGGGVFSLSAKSIPVSPEMGKALGLGGEVTTMTPAELKRAVLLAPVDLLWNGGIGTYIKASTETDAEIGDRGNDSIRVNGNELRVRVVGEGGNLGVSQRGRIEAALSGISINTDAIDNSAGVGTSDREVNIKILLGAALRDGRLERPARDELLQSMTAEVAHQVLRDNYEQNVLLGNSRANAAEMLPSHVRLIEWLEGRDELDRELESLPSTTEIAKRIAEGTGLTRPEFAVLVAYSKLALKTDLAETDLSSDPWFARTLAEYFPEPIREQYPDDLAEHPLASEIIVNTVVNSMVNRGGITFAYRAADETGGTSEQIARAYVVAREVFDLRGFVVDVEATDNIVPTSLQTDLYLSFRGLLDRSARWFVQHRRDGVDIGHEIDQFSGPVEQLAPRLHELMRGDDLKRYEARVEELESAGVPPALAERGARLIAAVALLDIVEQARLSGWDLEEVASVYFAMSSSMEFDELLERVSELPQDDRWGSMAWAAIRDDLYATMIALAASVIEHTEPVAGATLSDSAESRIAAWFEQGGEPAHRARNDALGAARAADGDLLATLSVALRRLRSLVR
ncbi:MAG: NAD-glutamate dehydrogenase [Leucobacter sp.]